MKVNRIFDLLDHYKENYNKEIAFSAKQDGKWVSVSSAQYIEMAHQFSYGLMALGYKKGDKILTISNNRPEWNIVDMGMAMLGVIHVPVYTSLSTSEYEYNIRHSDSKMIIAGGKKFFEKLKPLADKIAEVNHFYTFDKVESASNWMEIITLGIEKTADYQAELEVIKRSISEEDCATLIYTSGTTGKCKGVMLSHKNLVRNFLAATEIFELNENDKYLSILPLCHVGGRLGNYQTQYSGSSIYYAENMGTIAANMKEISPDGFDTVPRILEKIYDNIIDKGNKLTGMKKRIFFWAVKIGLAYQPFGLNGWLYEQKLKIADKLIFSKWREAIGGKMRMAGCGGASLQPRLERIFWAAGIKVVNMYGLTETSPIMTINGTTRDKCKLGTTGCVIDGVEVKLASDGEILCKGHNVMIGYYKDTELTKSVFDKEGWFHTGDIGEWVDGKFLKITDRKKEIFKLSNGKFIAPQVIENKFKESVLIEQLMVVGEHEKFASALISPNFSYLKEYCTANHLTFNSRNELIQLPEINNYFSEEVKKFNKDLSDSERINRFRLVPDEWTPETGELSPTLKLKRKVIDQKYKNLLEEIYVK